MKKLSTRKTLANRSIPAIIAVGSSLTTLPAAALELGELTVQSRLGQPLRASIAYALAANEQLSDYCVTMRPGPSVSGLPGFGAATVRITNGVILLTGKTPVREPMVSAHVVVDCPYSANLSREYLLFIDPLVSAYEQTAVTRQADSADEPIIIAPAAIRRPVASVTSQPINKDIAPSTRYQVQAGNTLSDIAARIQNRPIGLWPAVNAIFAANPDAFVNNDPNQLKVGSWISIPAFDGNAAAVVTPEPVAEPAAEVSAAAYADPVAFEPEPAIDMTNDLQPGDVILETQLDGPTTASSSPNVPTAIISSSSLASQTLGADGAASPSWFIWLAGSGIALVFGLLMFGRRLGGRSGTAPAATLAGQPHRRRFSDTQTTDTEKVAALGVDHDLSDDSPTEENLVLDADLVMGTGLEQSATSDAAVDFGFAAKTDLDIEFPFELAAGAADEHSILESEVLPENDDEDDDYDMSVIVDATKMPQPEDVTEWDLKAVEIVSNDETLIDQNYTISKEVDYQVLEQDYEDEMTATQALNEEIARAAAELNARMGNSNDDFDDDTGTTALPLATVTDLDITTQMPAQNDEISDLDDTGVNEAVTVNMAADDETAEMPLDSEKAAS